MNRVKVSECPVTGCSDDPALVRRTSAQPTVTDELHSDRRRKTGSRALILKEKTPPGVDVQRAGTGSWRRSVHVARNRYDSAACRETVTHGRHSDPSTVCDSCLQACQP